MEKRQEKSCPLCGELIRAEATFCRFCNRDLDDADLLRAHARTRRMAMGLLAFFGVAVLLTLLGSLLAR